MEDLEKALADVDARFEIEKGKHEKAQEASRAAQIEMIRLQGEHRALSRLLPPKEA